MNSEPKFLVLTSSDIRAGTVIHYLLRTTGARIAKIYVDRGTASTSSKRPAGTAPSLASLRLRDRFRYHAHLAARMPRHYLFRVLERCTGIDELEFLFLCERLHPELLRRVCEFPLPEALGVRPVLHRLTSVSRAFGIPIEQTTNLNDPATLVSLRAERPDVLIGLGTRILSRALLGVPRLGTLNAHSSLLPDYRGGTTEFWQLVHGEARTGISIHWMAPRVDEGDLCVQSSWPIPRGANHHCLRLMSLLHRLEPWREVVERLLRGELPRTPQRTPGTPTFRHPTLRQQYEFYCLHRVPSEEPPQDKRIESAIPCS